MAERIEDVIFQNLMKNEEYMRKVSPFLKAEYFLNPTDKILFKEVSGFIEKYSNCPSADAIVISVSEDKSMNESTFKEVKDKITSVEKSDASHNMEWLIAETEKFCKDRAIYNAITASIDIIDGKSKSLKTTAIPDILKDALAVGFDRSVGHDYLEDSDERFKYYHEKHDKYPFDIEYFNNITNGGFEKGTLNVILGGTGVGKTLVMGHMAAFNLAIGKNVLYITMEMGQYPIGERIDANLMGVTMDNLRNLPKPVYDKKIAEMKKRIKGKLIIKQYPTSCAGVSHFRALLHELKIKKDFTPDIMYIDYINICCSSRYKQMGGSINSYSFVKAMAEEMRGLAVEVDVPIVTATQTNREGYANSDPSLTNTSESFGLPATADFMVAIIANEGEEEDGHYLVKQLKNRYSDVSRNSKSIIGVDKSMMKLFDIPEAERQQYELKSKEDRRPESREDGLLGVVRERGKKPSFGERPQKYNFDFD